MFGINLTVEGEYIGIEGDNYKSLQTAVRTLTRQRKKNYVKTLECEVQQLKQKLRSAEAVIQKLHLVIGKKRKHSELSDKT